MLKFNHVSAAYGAARVLRDVNLTVRPGRLTALVGRNGSGKSTLLSCVNQQTAYSGEILLNGENLAALAPKERAKKIAIAPQNLPSPHITAREMAAFGRNPWLDFTGRLRAEDERIVQEALTRCGLEQLAERYVDTLSGGEKQRLVLAMILAQKTPLALLDEPTAHMDHKYQAEFLEPLSRPEGTFLVILHDLSLAVRYARDIIVLDGGRVVFCGSREECLETEILEKTFGLRRFTAREGDQIRIFFSAE